MQIDVLNEQGRVPVTVFRLQGDLTEEEPLQSQAQEAYQVGARHLLLDLKDVEYISSSGLRALHSAYMLLSVEHLPEDDRPTARQIMSGAYTSPYLKLYKPGKNAMKALSVAGYDLFLEIHDNYQEAIASF